ncbi:MAG: DUF2085 domain-containing protein [Candidatus Thermoplasmatota archaeon]|nr:DUF2085 domain-containing protein [Candidatus Thermoplasmatota archaeon]
MVDIGFRYLSGRVNKLVFVVFVVILFYTLSLFIVPLTLEPGTVEGLDGAANRIVHREEWEDLPYYHRAIYLFSDLNCHQKHERSYSLNGNQMPVCARDVGIFIGFSLGFLLMSFVRGARNLKDILLDTMNLDTSISEIKKTIILIILGAAFTLPLILDGSIQLISDYESFNAFRTFTGLLFGFGFSVFISGIILSSSPFEDY